MKAQNKNLDYYLGLNYDVVIRMIERDGERFFQAFSKELDRLSFYGVGETPEEAIRSFQETKKALFQDHLENGLPIAEPIADDDGIYSGKFVVRTTPQIHRNLILNAGRNGQSLNSLINGIFTQYLTAEDLLASVKVAIDSAVAMAVAKVDTWTGSYGPQPQDWKYRAPEERKAIAA